MNRLLAIVSVYCFAPIFNFAQSDTIFLDEKLQPTAAFSAHQTIVYQLNTADLYEAIAYDSKKQKIWFGTFIDKNFKSKSGTFYYWNAAGILQKEENYVSNKFIVAASKIKLVKDFVISLSLE